MKHLTLFEHYLENSMDRNEKLELFNAFKTIVWITQTNYVREHGEDFNIEEFKKEVINDFSSYLDENIDEIV